jgi:hypothetical protein
VLEQPAAEAPPGSVVQGESGQPIVVGGKG